MVNANPTPKQMK